MIFFLICLLLTPQPLYSEWKHEQYTYICVLLAEWDLTFASAPGISGKQTTLLGMDQKSLTLQSPVGHRVILLLAVFEILGQWFTVDSKGVVRPTEWLTPGVLLGNLPCEHSSTGQTSSPFAPLRWHYSDAIGKNNTFASYSLNMCTAR